MKKRKKEWKGNTKKVEIKIKKKGSKEKERKIKNKRNTE
jgi:hypothetical protein